MPIIKTFVSHHGGDYDLRVAPILRQVAPMGVRPWIDKRDLADRVGFSLDEQLQEPIFKESCSSLSLFLSKASVARPYLEAEFLWALQRCRDRGFRIIPIWLDPPDQIVLPDSFREFLSTRKALWLEPQKDPRFVEKYVASILDAGGLTPESKELTLFLGHRISQWFGSPYEEWGDKPTLDLRLNLDGTQNCCPTGAEWQEIEAGLQMVRSKLTKLRRINICGQAPLGVGTLIGTVWDRCSGTTEPIELHSHNSMAKQVWTTNPMDYEQCGQWKPATAQHLKMDAPMAVRHDTLLLVLTLAGREEYLSGMRAWNQARPAPSLFHTATIPAPQNPEHAQELVRECVGAIRFLRRTCPNIDTIEIIFVLPLALVPLITYHLRTVKRLHIYDEVKGSNEYRLVIALP